MRKILNAEEAKKAIYAGHAITCDLWEPNAYVRLYNKDTKTAIDENGNIYDADDVFCEGEDYTIVGEEDTITNEPIPDSYDYILIFTVESEVNKNKILAYETKARSDYYIQFGDGQESQGYTSINRARSALVYNLNNFKNELANMWGYKLISARIVKREISYVNTNETYEFDFDNDKEAK